MILRTYMYLLYIKISQSSLVVLMALLNGSCIPHEKWVVISVTLSICCTYFTEGGSGTDPEKKTMQISMINTFKVVIHTLQLKQHYPLYTAGQIFNTATYFSDFLFMSCISPVECTQTWTTHIHFLKIFVAASVAVSRRANSHLATMAE